MKRLARVLSVIAFAVVAALVDSLAYLAATVALALALSLFIPGIAAVLISPLVVAVYRGVRLGMRGETR